MHPYSLVQRAQKSLIVIDGYVDVATLNVIAKKTKNVSVEIYTLPNAKTV